MKASFAAALLLLVGAVLGAQTQVPAELADGLRSFQAGDIESALTSFEAALARTDTPAWHGHELFWTGRAEMALERYSDAADTFDRFLTDYPAHAYREEASYQRARIFYLQGDFESAVQRFSDFRATYPRSEFTANALYWAGESLYSLGRLDDAARLFAEVTDKYPTSFRAEAARYRLDIIDLSRRENELLTLLQWSHEEYLSALEGFQQRERSYQEALRSYRERFATMATGDFRQEIADLNAQNEQLQTRVDEQDATINDLLARLRQTSVTAPVQPQNGMAPASSVDASATPAITAPHTSSPTPQTASDLEARETLLSLKAQALDLQELLLRKQEENR